MNKRAAKLYALALSVGCAFSFPAMAQPDPSTGKLIHRPNAIAGKYIVVLKKAAKTPAASPTASRRAATFASKITGKYGIFAKAVYEDALSGFAIEAPEELARTIANDPDVDYVEEDSVMSINATQSPADWGLDRVDQRNLPRDGSYTYDQTGAGVNVYVIDSGIRSTHVDFGGRVSLDYSAISDGLGASDCNGHGTHVAGTIGGSAHGIAKSVTLHSVRVFGCSGSGNTSDVIAGVNWVTANRTSPAVVNMSLGGSSSPALNSAVTNSINSGITYVVAAGNDNGADACNYSPSGANQVISVGATDSNDARASYSNVGRCVHLFAPGSGVTSNWYTSDTATQVLNGTSMATPHVTGVAALYLQTNPSASWSTVYKAVAGMVTYGVLSNLGGSPNHLLYSRPSMANRGALFRYNNTWSGGHFYTMDWTELYGAGVSSWYYEKVQGYLASTNVANTTPLYHYVNYYNGDHFYTVNWNAYGGYTYVGISGYVPTAPAGDTANLYRYYNTWAGQHFYTTDWSELGGGGFGAWVYEGVECQVWTTP